MKISKRVQRCDLSPMRKFHPYAVQAKAQGKHIYHLNIGQPDIETPPVYFKAIQEFPNPVIEYVESPGIPPLVHAVQTYYKGIGVMLDEQDILITTGGSEALNILMMCILDEGDEVLIPEPFYPNYSTFIYAAGGSIRPIPTTPEEGYHYATREKIEAQINEKTRAILITNPSNPTGVILTDEERRMILDVAKEHDLYLISDEVYREFYYNGQGLATMATFEDSDENLVIIDSVSKRFSACGARIGSLISKNRELMSQALKFCQARLSVATLDQNAAAALYTVDKSYFENVREEYRRRRDTLIRKLHEIPDVACEQPDGAFYVMVSLPIDDAEEFQKWLLTDFDDNGDTVMFAPGRSFYATPGKGINEIRISYTLKEEALERAIDLLRLGIEAYKNR